MARRKASKPTDTLCWRRSLQISGCIFPVSSGVRLVGCLPYSEETEMSDESLRFPSGRSVGNCRKDAKRSARIEGISYYDALDKVAHLNGVAMPWAKALSVVKELASPIQQHGLQMTAADIKVVMDNYPDLTHFGRGIYYESSASRDERTAKFRVQRDCLANAVDECNRAVRFLMHVNKRKTVNFTRTSYGLKHRVEHYMKNLPDVEDYYVANGSFICAAIHMGFIFAPAKAPGSPNVCFNISDRSPIFEWEKLLARASRGAPYNEKLSDLEKVLGVKPRHAHVDW